MTLQDTLSGPPVIPERALFALEPGGCRLLRQAGPGVGLHEVCEGLRGGVYTALRSYGGHRFLGLDEHLDRLQRNLDALGLGPLDRERLRAGLDELARAHPAADVRVRIDVLPEPPAELGTESTLLVALVPHEPIPPEFLEEGVAVKLTDRLQRTRPRIKTTEWIAERNPLPLQQADCYEHVMVDAAGNLLECTSANFFGVRAGAVQTVDDGVLEGITRGLLFGLIEREGLELIRRPITLDDYATLDEAFLTSSTRGIVPIVRIEDAVLSAGRPGPVTVRLMRALEALIEREARPARSSATSDVSTEGAGGGA